MKTLKTQFDDHRLSSAVATPTCSSCCCCCCCLATTVASSTLLAQRVAKEGERHHVADRYILTVIAALFVPIVGALMYAGAVLLLELTKSCTQESYFSTTLNGPRSYNVCSNPTAGFVLPLLILIPFAVLFYLYSRVYVAKPAKRAALVTVLIAISFIAEFFAGAFLILTGIGGIAYLLLIPVFVGWITVWYRKHLNKEVPTVASQLPSPQQTGPNSQQHDTIQTQPDSPAEPDTPPPGSK